MAREKVGQAKFQVPGGQATPAPPVGTSLGKYGVNLGQFVQQFNDRTKEFNGMPIPVVITAYADRTFTFTTKTPPASYLLKKAAGLEKGNQTPGRATSGKVSASQVREIAEQKMKDLNANDLDAAEKIIAGTARQMGVDVK
jgi:large subunit ribosomal protein L11